MSFPYIIPPTAGELLHKKAWELADYFAKEFPKASMKIAVEYRCGRKFVIQQGGDNE